MLLHCCVLLSVLCCLWLHGYSGCYPHRSTGVNVLLEMSPPLTQSPLDDGGPSALLASNTPSSLPSDLNATISTTTPNTITPDDADGLSTEEITLAQLQARYDEAVGNVALNLPGTLPVPSTDSSNGPPALTSSSHGTNTDPASNEGTTPMDGESVLRTPARDADDLNPLLSSVFQRLNRAVDYFTSSLNAPAAGPQTPTL